MKLGDGLFDQQDQAPPRRTRFDQVEPIGPYIKNLDKNAKLARQLSEKISSKELSGKLQRLSEKCKNKAGTFRQKDNIEESRLKDFCYQATKIVTECLKKIQETRIRDVFDKSMKVQEELGWRDTLEALVGNLDSREVKASLVSIANTYDLDKKVDEIDRSDKYDALDTMIQVMGDDLAPNFYQEIPPRSLEDALQGVIRDESLEELI